MHIQAAQPTNHSQFAIVSFLGGCLQGRPEKEPVSAELAHVLLQFPYVRTYVCYGMRPVASV